MVPETSINELTCGSAVSCLTECPGLCIAAVLEGTEVRHTDYRPNGVILLALMCCVFLAYPCEAEDAERQWLPPKDTGATRIRQVDVSDRTSMDHTFRIQNAGVHESLIFRSPRAASQLHNDFEASLSVVASAAGVRPGLIVLLPEQIDPRTGQPLQMIILG